MADDDMMSEDEIIEKAEALPGRFARRLTDSALWRVAAAASTACSRSSWRHPWPPAGVPVTAAERDELLALLKAMHMPADPIAELNVEG